MSNEEWKIQISPKTPAGTLINIRGNTPEEVQALINGVHELVVLITSLEQAIGGVATVAPLSIGNTTQSFPTQPPVSNQVSQTPPATSGPTCLHGARVYKSGTKKDTGKPWSGWSCPAPRDQQCPMVWA